jgi:hypothetical protein
MTIAGMTGMDAGRHEADQGQWNRQPHRRGQGQRHGPARGSGDSAGAPPRTDGRAPRAGRPDSLATLFEKLRDAAAAHDDGE